MSRRGTLHHVELWVPDLTRAEASWGWLLGRLGYTIVRRWPAGQSWELGTSYVSIESGPDVVAAQHERTRPGVNHLAFWGGSRAEVDEIVVEAGHHGWTLMFVDRHPYAGGKGHYAAYLEDVDGYEVELVADPPRSH
jgi:catechol 2,3-dioxygenase-like lactoylglutathione lyase family enzyme